MSSNTNTLSMEEQLLERKRRLSRSRAVNSNINNNNNNMNDNNDNINVINHPLSPIPEIPATDRVLNQTQMDREIALQLQRQYDQENNNNHNLSSTSSISPISLSSETGPTNFQFTYNNGNGQSMVSFSSSSSNPSTNPILHELMNNDDDDEDQIDDERNDDDPFNVMRMNAFPLFNMNVMIDNLVQNFHHNGHGEDINPMILPHGMRFMMNPNGSRPRGAEQENIDNLPTDTYKMKEKQNNVNAKSQQMDENNDDKKENEKEDECESCSICLESFKNGETIRRLPCLHIFHKNEIDRWLRTNHVCPICRAPIEQN